MATTNKTRTGYVVMEQGWEYNDEIYHRPESGGGTACGVFFSKEKAQKEADRLTAKELPGLELSQYTYDGVTEVVDQQRAKELVEILGLDKPLEEDEKRNKKGSDSEEDESEEDDIHDAFDTAGVRRARKGVLTNEKAMVILEAWWENTEGALPKSLTVEKSIEIARCLELEFYTVEEVDVEVEG